MDNNNHILVSNCIQPTKFEHINFIHLKVLHLYLKNDKQNCHYIHKISIWKIIFKIM